MLESIDLTNILLNIIFILIFTTLFFFIYITKIENEIFKKEIDLIIKDIVSDIKIIIPQDIIDFGKKNIHYNNKNNFIYLDKDFENNNINIFNNACYSMLIFIIIGFVIIYNFYTKSDISNILINNIIILFFVFLLEYIFLKYILNNYNFVNTNFIKLTILQLFDEYKKN